MPASGQCGTEFAKSQPSQAFVLVEGFLSELGFCVFRRIGTSWRQAKGAGRVQAQGQASSEMMGFWGP